MAKFIEVNLDNTDQVVMVNADKIIKFWRGSAMNYTVIEFEGDNPNITVKEWPNDLWNACNG